MQIKKIEKKDCGAIGITIADGVYGELKILVFEHCDSFEIGMGYELKGKIISKRTGIQMKRHT